MGKQFIQYYEQKGFDKFLNEYLEKNNVKVLSITPVLGSNINCVTATIGFYVLFQKEQ